jgi:hypothetical protein
VAVDGPNGTFQWSLRGPKAVLFDYDTGEPAGTHSQGPIWEAKDGGKVLGEVLSKKEAPNRGAVDWLLLRAKENAGNGRFGKVTFITRADTWAGRPPKALPKTKDATSDVRYQATYVFWGRADLKLKGGKAIEKAQFALDDMKAHDHYFRVHTVNVRAGHSYVITMTSDDFTPYLHLEDSSGKYLMSESDRDGTLKVGSTWTVNAEPGRVARLRPR